MTPLDAGRHGPHDFVESSFSIVPLIGSLLLIALLVAGLAALYLWQQGRLPLAGPGRRTPEDDARRILAERFARGDLSGEEFLERASILNWSPGTEPVATRRRRRL